MSAPEAALLRAAQYRALSLLFVPPTDNTGAELRALAAELMPHAPAWAEPLAALAADSDAPLGPLYHLALGPTGAVRDCESDYEVNPLGGKGPLLADIAGFYRAFHYEDETLLGLGPDHIAQELGYLAWLSMRVAFAWHTRDADGEALCREASARFVEAHLGRWLLTFCARVRERCPETWYDAAVQLTEGLVAELEPSALLPAQPDRNRRSLPTLHDDDDTCGLPPDA